MVQTSNTFNWIILCAIFASGVYFIYYANAEFARDMNYYIAPLTEQPAVKKRQATLVLDYEGKKRVFAGAVLPNMTVSDVLLAVAPVGGFEVKLKPRLVIDGRADSPLGEGKKWKLFINSKEIAENALSVRVVGGYEVLAKYE